MTLALLHPDKTRPDLAVWHKGAGGPGITENPGDGPLGGHLGSGVMSGTVFWNSRGSGIFFKNWVKGKIA